MSAKLVFRDKEYEVKAGQTIRDAIRQCGLMPETVLPVRDGELLTDDNIVREGEVIKLVAVISGGSTCAGGMVNISEGRDLEVP